MKLIILLYTQLATIMSSTVKLPNKEDIKDTQQRLLRRLSQHGQQYRKNLVLQRIRHARRRNATCMDGTDARYYLSRQHASQNWIIHLQSGGGCVTKTECRDRANGPLGSSIPLENKITGEWTVSNDPGINPTFHSWNKVVIPYCSGDVFVGRQLKKNHPYRLPMLGHYILVAVIKDLISRFKINGKSNKILFGGTSAGGVGVLANVDHVQKLLRPADVKGYVDSGWFTLYPNYGEDYNQGLVESGLPRFFSTLTELFEEHWNGFVDESCRQQMPKAAACLYGQLAIPYIKTPIFVLSVFWDSYQLTQMRSVEFPLINVPPARDTEVNYFSSFGNNTRHSLLRVMQYKQHGVFSPACYAHTFFTTCIDGLLCSYPNDRIYYIKGKSAYSALTEWYQSDGRRGTYIDSVTEEPSCNPSCCSVNCHTCRTYTQNTHVTTNSVEDEDSSKKNSEKRIVYYSNSRRTHTGLTQTMTFLLAVLYTYNFVLGR